MDFFRKIAQQFRDFFMKLTPARRTAMVVTSIVVAVAITGLLFWTGDTAYQVLGSNLPAEDATATMRFLREKKIPFKVEHDGKTIKVPAEAIHELRLELAASGVAQTGIVGYEVFDKQNFSTTSFVQKINNKRALEGELMRTINTIKGVRRSRVHLALPNKSTFVEDQKRTSASVVLDMDPSSNLSEKQILGVSRMVAAAVEGMELGDVTILDANGKLLSKNNNDPVAAQTAAMLDYQQKMEAEYETRIQDLLTRVVGEGKVVAKVSLDLDFTQSTETQTQYDQEGAAIRSQQKETQNADGSRPVPMGAPGAAANTPNQPNPGTPEVKSTTSHVNETTNFAVPEKVVRSSKPVGSVKRMSVAVLVDGNYVKDAAKGDAPAAFQKWSDEKLAEFKTLVTSSVGLDPKRGDSIEIKNIEFRHQDLEDADAQIQAYERRKMISNLVQYLVMGIGIILFFVFAVRPFIKWLTDNTVESMESFLPKTIEELEKIETSDPELQEMEEAVPVIVDKVDPEKIEGEMIKEKVVTLIEGNPQKAAMILHEWVLKPSKISESEKADKVVGGAKS